MRWMIIGIAILNLVNNAFAMGETRENSPHHSMISGFLALDIQKSPEQACELKEKISDIKANKILLWERIGNVYYAILMKDYVLIAVNDSSNDKQVLVPFSEFEQEVLEKAKQFDCSKIKI